MILNKDAVILGTLYPAGTELECSEEVAEEGYKQAARQVTRQAIKEASGCDSEALLGVALDSVHVLTYGMALIYASIDEAKNFAELKAKLEPMQELSKQFLAQVEQGNIKLPYLAVKHGVAPVFEDLAKTATATTEAMLSLQAIETAPENTTEVRDGE